MCTGEAKVKESVPPVIMADLTEENDDAPVKSPDPRVGNHFYVQAMKNKIGNTFPTDGWGRVAPLPRPYGNATIVEATRITMEQAALLCAMGAPVAFAQPL